MKFRTRTKAVSMALAFLVSEDMEKILLGPQHQSDSVSSPNRPGIEGQDKGPELTLPQAGALARKSIESSTMAQFAAV